MFVSQQFPGKCWCTYCIWQVLDMMVFYDISTIEMGIKTSFTFNTNFFLCTPMSLMFPTEKTSGHARNCLIQYIISMKHQNPLWRYCSCSLNPIYNIISIWVSSTKNVWKCDTKSMRRVSILSGLSLQWEWMIFFAKRDLRCVSWITIPW